MTPRGPSLASGIEKIALVNPPLVTEPYARRLKSKSPSKVEASVKMREEKDLNMTRLKTHDLGY